MPDGNEAQVRIAVEKVADAAIARFAAAHPPRSPSEKLLQWMPLVIVVLTAFWTFAIQSQQVSQNRSEIDKLQIQLDRTSGVIQSVDSRLARIETTLDIITGGGERVQSRAPR